MILKRLQASFGKLDGAVLTLQPGLNLLYAPNEGGKSTWCAFLLAMLYGIDASQRDSKAALADKHKYQPWSGKPMAGRIDLVWQGRAVTIERSSTPKAPFSVFRAYDTDSGVPIDSLQAATCGQILTGLPRSVFARSVFLAQEAHALTYDEALEQQLQRLVSTGPQEATFAQAKQQLQQLQRRCQHHKAGLIPACQAELAQCEQALAQRSALEDACAQQQKQLAQLDDAYRNAASHCAAQTDAARQDAQLQAKLANVQLAALTQQQAALPEDAQLRQWMTQLAAAPAEPPRQKHRRWPFLAAALLLAVAAALLRRSLPAAIACGVLSLASALAALRPARQMATGHLPAEIAAAFPQAKTREEAQTAILDALALPQRRAQAEAQARQADAALQLLQLLPTQPRNDAMQALDARRTSCRQQLAADQARLEAYPPLLQLQQQRSALTKRLAALTQHYEALGLALDALQQASDALQARFAPPLRQLAGTYLARLTGTPHRQLELDRQLQVRLQEPGDPVAHSSRCYSAATCDQIWLALRLAIAQLLAPPETPCILDDALVCFDDARMARALELLRQLAQQRQILLFTCQTREQRYLDSLNPPQEGAPYGKEKATIPAAPL